MTQVKRRKGWRMSCDVGEVTERLENELCSARIHVKEGVLVNMADRGVIHPTSY